MPKTIPIAPLPTGSTTNQVNPKISNIQATNFQTKTPGQSVAPPVKGTNSSSPTSSPVDKPKPPKSERKPLVNFLPLITIILCAALVTQLLLITIFSKNVTRSITNQAIINRQQADEKLAQAAVTDHQEEIEQLSQSFPDLEGIRKFAQTQNTQLDQFPQKEFNISAIEPVMTPDLFAPLIPVTIKVTATPSAFTPIMQKLAESNYLFQPIKIEINAAEGLTNYSKIEYRGNLFVSKKLLE